MWSIAALWGNVKGRVILFKLGFAVFLVFGGFEKWEFFGISCAFLMRFLGYFLGFFGQDIVGLHFPKNRLLSGQFH